MLNCGMEQMYTCGQYTNQTMRFLMCEQLVIAKGRTYDVGERQKR